MSAPTPPPPTNDSQARQANQPGLSSCMMPPKLLSLSTQLTDEMRCDAIDLPCRSADENQGTQWSACLLSAGQEFFLKNFRPPPPIPSWRTDSTASHPHGRSPSFSVFRNWVCVRSVCAALWSEAKRGKGVRVPPPCCCSCYYLSTRVRTLVSTLAYFPPILLSVLFSSISNFF